MVNEYTLSQFEYFSGRDMSHSLDSLTWVVNRETLFGYVNWLVEKGRPFSFFFVDLDNFKNVNDTYGHLVGDIALMQTAAYLVKSIGEKGVVARYGGDEFIVVFENQRRFNEVSSFGRNLNAHSDSIVIQGAPNLAVTLSIGVARYPQNGKTAKEIIDVADKALYLAKMKGRNCCVIYQAAQHAELSIEDERERKQSQMQLCSSLFANLTAGGEDISLAVDNVFKSMVSYFMFDHICLEGSGINHSVAFEHSPCKQFKHIPAELISPLINEAGYFSMSNARSLDDSAYDLLVEECKSRKIKSILLCKISAYGTGYGYIRVDTYNSVRIWQNNEIALVIAAANALGLLLHYQHKTLEDLPLADAAEVGSEG